MTRPGSVRRTAWLTGERVMRRMSLACHPWVATTMKSPGAWSKLIVGVMAELSAVLLESHSKVPPCSGGVYSQWDGQTNGRLNPLCPRLRA